MWCVLPLLYKETPPVCICLFQDLALSDYFCVILTCSLWRFKEALFLLTKGT